MFLDRYKEAVGRLFSHLSETAVLGLMSYQLIQKQIQIGDVLLIQRYYTKFNNHLKEVVNSYDIYLRTCTKMYRLAVLLEECKNMPQLEPQVPRHISSDWEEISFSNVTFQYESKQGTRPALDDVSFSVRRGEKFAIVGHSGSGKSTIVKLLLRLYLPTKGKIFLGKTNILDVMSEELYECIKVVPQDDELLNCTLLQNLQFATSRQIREEDAIEALKKGDAWDFVKELPDKLNSMIGPGGVRLSGGETQRICIARALISCPSVIVLDEATSSLDVVTEQKVHATMAQMAKDTTVIAVTHRISSLYLFDRVLVMHKGKVVGEGTHDELLASNPHYQNLQKRAFKEDTSS
jgi:ABC-type multidrug transport system fused ATPase/permease subunit